jgi:hypothetical protein
VARGIAVTTSHRGWWSAGCNEASGVVAKRASVQCVILTGTQADIPLRSVPGALRRDPLSLAYLEGGVLLNNQVVLA